MASRCRGASSTEKTVGRRVQVVVQAFDKWKVARTAGVAPIYWSYEYPFERPEVKEGLGVSDKKSCSAEFGYDEDDCDEDDAATDGPIKKVNRRAQCADPP